MRLAARDLALKRLARFKRTHLLAGPKAKRQMAKSEKQKCFVIALTSCQSRLTAKSNEPVSFYL